MSRAIVLTPLFAVLVACGDAPPPGLGGSGAEDGTGGSDGSTEPRCLGTEDASYYPLVDGATYEYEVRKPGEPVERENTWIEATSYQGKEAFALEDEPDAFGQASRSILQAEGTRVRRVHKDVTVNGEIAERVQYDPGFVRFDDAWIEPGMSEVVGYDRSEWGAGDAEPDVEYREHEWTVLEVGEIVETPAGCFETVKVRRVRTTGQKAGQVVNLWFARGVGKVYEERPGTGESEQLLAVDVPGGVSAP